MENISPAGAEHRADVLEISAFQPVGAQGAGPQPIHQPPVAGQRVETHGGRAGHRRSQSLDGGVPIGPLDQPQRPRGPLGVEGRAGQRRRRRVARRTLQALSRGVEPRGRCADRRARGKLTGNRLHGVQFVNGQIALQFGCAAPDLSRAAVDGVDDQRVVGQEHLGRQSELGQVTRTPPATRWCRSDCTPWGVSS